ncbi:hypothetical protein [Lysobacter fragariae]
MSNVVQFLETLGRNPALNYSAAVAALDVEDAERRALLARDQAALNDLLGGRKKVLCALFPAEGDEPKQDEQPDDGEAPDGEASIRN